MSQSSKLTLIKETIEAAEAKLRSAKLMLNELISGDESIPQAKGAKLSAPSPTSDLEEGGNIIEGVFNGQTMLDNNGKEYPIPANYASKSKLVPGDVLKLTVKDDGSFLFKQIGPVERKKLIGTLTYEDGQYKVIAEGKAYKVLLASVTYYKGEVGDKVTLIVPENMESEWGAIENILPPDITE